MPGHRSVNRSAQALRSARSPRAEFIERSHRRSSAFGLSRIESCELNPLLCSELDLAREQNRRLCVHAAPVIHMLFEQIADTESMIVLADARGTILHSVGDDDFLGRAGKVALAPGENWAEHSKGTNAIGTALFEAVPTLVHAQEHFIHANAFLTCSAAPIFDLHGNMLGVLDVTSDQRGYHQHTMGLVRMSARLIENHWLLDDCARRLRLHFHSRAECVGTLLEGIVVLEPDGSIVGANRGALEQLGISDLELCSHDVASLFGTSAAAVVDRFRKPHAARRADAPRRRRPWAWSACAPATRRSKRRCASCVGSWIATWRCWSSAKPAPAKKSWRVPSTTTRRAVGSRSWPSNAPPASSR
jgi:sigma-54 dependent transcriptional regulator, acetoin dehydrogenase operon transcriptional activator AcoR